MNRQIISTVSLVAIVLVVAGSRLPSQTMQFILSAMKHSGVPVIPENPTARKITSYIVQGDSRDTLMWAATAAGGTATHIIGAVAAGLPTDQRMERRQTSRAHSDRSLNYDH